MPCSSDFRINSERRGGGVIPQSSWFSSERGMIFRGAKAVVGYSAIRLASSAAVSSIPREGYEFMMKKERKTKYARR